VVREKTREELAAENAVLRRRLAEREGAEDAEARILRALLEHAPDFIVTMTGDGRFLTVNRMVTERPPEELVGSSLFDHLPLAARETVRACFDRVMATGQADEYETEVLVSDGRRIPFWTRVAPIREGGRVVALCAIARDMSRVKATERALRQSEETVRLAVTATGMGLWSWDEENGWAGDEAWRRIYGLSPEQQPRTLEQALNLVHADDRASIVAGLRALVGKGREVAGEFRIVRPDQSVRWVLSRGVALRDDDGRIRKVVGGDLDVTERREVEERLRQTQLMEALGALTAGVAHHFNNLLMTMLPNLEAAAEQAPPPLTEPLASAREAALRAMRLVRDLSLVAGRRKDSERRDESLLALAEEAASLCRSTFPDGITVTVAARGPLSPVAVDAPQILQAILNLCLNARDAVMGLTDRTRSIEVSIERIPAGSGSLPEQARRLDHLRIDVTDNGVGMPEEVQRRAFEPFFTTKEVGKGTGLGLATTYAIVKNHGGWITLRSVPGKGSTASMLLPAITCGRSPEPALAPQAAARPVGRRILIVDDEAAVRAIVGRILSDAGYDVVYAADGAEALERFDREGPFAVVLLDESMPGMPGRAVLERLLARDPAVKVVMFTGYGPEAESVVGAAGVLEKPVAIDALLGFLQRVLGRPPAVVG
jgi:PAS domain S-box-containing protein